MDKKLKKVLVWSSVISVSCIIFLYSISYVFPIPAKQIKKIQDIKLSEFGETNVVFEEYLYNNNIQFKKHVYRSTGDLIYIYKVGDQNYLKSFFPMFMFLDKSSERYPKFKEIKIDGDILIGYMEIPGPKFASFFIYNKDKFQLTEYFLNGGVGGKFNYSYKPAFFYNKVTEQTLLNDLFVGLNDGIEVITKDNYVKVSLPDSGKTTIANTNEIKLNTVSGFATDIFIILYLNKHFYIFDAVEKVFISKQYFPQSLRQPFSSRPLYVDTNSTYYCNFEKCDNDGIRKEIQITLEKVFDYPIMTNPLLNDINRNTIDFTFYGTQYSDHFILNAINIRAQWNYRYNEIRKYVFQIPGRILECKKVAESIFAFKTDDGQFFLPDLDFFKRMDLADYNNTNIDIYPYEMLFGGDNFVIRNIMGYYERKPATIVNLLEFFFLYILFNPIFLLPICLILLIRLNSYIAKKRNSAKNSSE